MSRAIEAQGGRPDTTTKNKYVVQSGESYKNGAGHELGREVDLEIDDPGNGIQHPGVYADAD